jgi:2-hydroxymuconate-semialdehyde hydrolase
MQKQRDEISKSIKTGDFMTNYHDYGEGFPLLLIHGSGPGVSAWANWRLVLPVLSDKRRVLAPDMVGFGYTERPEGITYSMEGWLKQAIDFLDAMGIEQTDVVGNSFGGSMALALAIHHPERVRKIVLMGAVGVDFPITYGLDFVWGYEPSVETMAKVLDLFVFDKSLLSDQLAEMRYHASVEPGFQEAFSSMFPWPRQFSVKSMAHDEALIKAIPHKTLIVHGREDAVIPLENSVRLNNLIKNSELHVFGLCGHWTQIEQTKKFNDLVDLFLSQE